MKQKKLIYILEVMIMKNFELINLAKAETMNEHELQIEIGKRTRYLKEEFGMDAVEAANFVSSLLNMGVGLNEIFKNKRLKKK